MRFAGREYDAETGLYFTRNRYYDPAVGRFISEDPVGIDGGLNLYSYAGLDPVNARDPFGKSFVCWTVTYTVYANAGYILWPDGKVDHVFESGVYSHDVRRCAYMPSGGGGGDALPVGRVPPTKLGGGPINGHNRPLLRLTGGKAGGCYETYKFSSLPIFGDGALRDVVETVETGSMISLAGDLVATSLKATRTGVGGPANPYASGINMVGRGLGRSIGSPKVTGAIVKVGDKATPVLAIIGAFTGAYNFTIDVQCHLGILE